MKTNRRTIVCSWLVALALAVSLIPYIPDTDVYAETLPEEPQSIQTAPDFLEPVESLTEVPDGFTGIYTTADLNLIRDGLTMKYILMNDISFTEADFAIGGDFYNGGLGFLPIGSDSTLSFQGVFNGNGHVISGMKQQVSSSTATIRLGLFGYTSNAQIVNLGLTGCVISAQTSTSGAGIVAGGITGNDSNSIIENCFFSGDITASCNGLSWGSYIGGIIGSGIGSTIANCMHYGEIIANNTAKQSQTTIGGIFGYVTGTVSAPDGAIARCFNLGKITASNAAINDTGVAIRTGGIAGWCSDMASIEQCGNAAGLEITNMGFGDVEAGGIGGVLNVELLTDCFNSGFINISQGKYANETFAGGIAGALPSNTTKSCYSAGAVGVNKNYLGIGNRTLAGGIGASASDVMDDCYYLDNMSRGLGDGIKPGPDIITGIPDLGLKLTEAQMMDSSVFAGFDFELTWEIKQGEAYPFPTLKGSIPWPPLESNTKYYDGGIGSSAHPYLISSKEQLDHVRMNLGANYQLSDSIIFTGSDFAAGASFYNNGLGFVPIGENRYTRGFEGTLDGQGFAIVGLYINRTGDSFSDYYCGLFSNLDGGTVKNLGLVDCDIAAHSSSGCCGGLVGKAERNALISSCYTTGKVKGANYAGGIVGVMSDGAQIENSFNTADITATAAAGGLVGATVYQSTPKVTNSYHAGSIQGGTYSKNIIGDMRGGTVSGCYSSYLSVMKLQSTYKEFDFENVWRIGEEEHYPFPISAINKYPLKYYYTITFENRGQTYIPDQRVAYHDKIIEPVTPTWYGHTFGGWSVYSSFVELWNFEEDVIEGGHYLFAKWTTDIYVLTFDSNGGSAVDSFSGVYGDFVPEPAPPSKQGYSFGGWFTNPECTLPWDFSMRILAYDMTLYAKWIPNTYTIKFNDNAVTTGSMTNMAMTYDVAKNLTANKFTKDGYLFLGWATSPSGEVVYKDKVSVNNLTATNGATINLYAKWAAPITSAASYNYNSIKISWAAAGNATSYRIYRATSATGSYSLVKIVDSTARSYVNTGLVTGKTYYYKVSVVASGKAYHHSAYKSAKAIPATPTIALSKYSSTSIKVSWIGVSGATKYQIFRATSATGTYTYLYTASPTIRSWVNTGLTRGKTYYYKVRAYHLEGTTKVYGATSAVKYLKL